MNLSLALSRISVKLGIQSEDPMERQNQFCYQNRDSEPEGKGLMEVRRTNSRVTTMYDQSNNANENWCLG